VARGTFYLYFPDKLALFEALVDRWWKPLLDTLEDVSTRLDAASTPLDALTTYLEMAQSLVDTALAHREEVLLGFREVRGAHEAGQRMRTRELQLVEAATALTEKAAAKGLIEVEDARLATLVILGAVERMHYEWLVGGDLGDQSALPEKVMRLMARMLGLPLP
jgi:AcrR family transcriptional regulator